MIANCDVMQSNMNKYACGSLQKAASCCELTTCVVVHVSAEGEK